MKRKSCACMGKIDGLLAPKNTALVPMLNFATGSARVALQVTKIDRAKRKPAACPIAIFCPFCGKRYPR